MRKWLIMVLLLANVLVFFAFFMLNKSTQPVSSSLSQEGAFLTLIKEARVVLVSRAIARHVDEKGALKRHCYLLSGITRPSIADEVKTFLSNQNYASTVQEYQREGLVYQLVVNDRWQDEEVEVISLLTRKGVRLKSGMLGVKSVLLAGEFDDLYTAKQLLGRIDELSMYFTLHKQYRQKTFYEVVYRAKSGDKLTSEINKVLLENYKMLKIEKKLCKGVAG